MKNPLIIMLLLICGVVTDAGLITADLPLPSENEKPSLTAEIGDIWQLTDVHLDEEYSTEGSVKKFCHKSESLDLSGKDNPGMPGPFGNFSCDSPLKLVTSAISAMKKIKPSPDFLLWTGDTGAHTHGMSFKDVCSSIKKVSELLDSAFGNETRIFPVLGNHDVTAPDQLPPDASKFYTSIFNECGWKKFIPDDESKTFLIGGYYSVMVKPGFSVAVLNTVLYAQKNKMTGDVADPAGQLAWLTDLLKSAASVKHKVMIVAHVPPGMSEANNDTNWFHPKYNDAFLQLIEKYSSVIGTQIYGHEHKDTFRIFYDGEGKPVNTAFLAPSLTPLKTRSGANNPSVRLLHYDRDFGFLHDIDQYTLNLSTADETGNATWNLEYTATKEYSIKDMTATTLDALSKTFESDASLFDKYIHHTSSGYNNGINCTDSCKKIQLCAMKNIDYSKFNVCLSTKPKDDDVDIKTEVIDAVTMATVEVPADSDDGGHVKPTTHHHHHNKKPVPSYMYYVIIGLVVLVIVLFIVIAFLCFRRPHNFTHPKYMRVHSTINS